MDKALGIEESVQIFYRAVAEKNWEVFLNFLNSNLPFYASLPGSIEIQEVEEFKESKKPWFFSNTGTFDYELINIESSSSLEAMSIVDVVYANVDEQGIAFQKNLHI
ncbi:MAG: hypothetical protein CL674_12475 [Bdellovibrionaceae bacterium]|mgnify:FL=1|nr:hypothetical protein [Pseudobdellovibrionaceae bacterium]